jgi:hypothetical protein
MPRTFARVDPSTRLVVDVQDATSPGECVELFGGTLAWWFNADIGGPAVVGQGWDYRFPTRYGELWTPGVYPADEVRFQDGRLWRNTVDNNSFAPPTNWRDFPPAGFLSDWFQPASEFDSYADGEYVNFAGTVARSLTAFNVWVPWVNWREVPADGSLAIWRQPTGSTDAYQIGEQVTHNGSDWENTSANNVFAPGVFGWVAL